MPSLIQRLARVFADAPEKKLALAKRKLERELQAGGLSRSEARRAVAAKFRGKT